MRLVIGGYAQGKLDYVLRGCVPGTYTVWDGELPQEDCGQEKAVILDHLHNWIKQRITDGESPEEEIIMFVDKHPDCVILCDEIGNGIVPVDAFEREYRERTGRIMTELAGRAEEVDRVICGIGQRIK